MAHDAILGLHPPFCTFCISVERVEAMRRQCWKRVMFDREPIPKYHEEAGWSSLVARWAHNPKVAGSNPAPATNQINILHGFSLPVSLRSSPFQEFVLPKTRLLYLLLRNGKVEMDGLGHSSRCWNRLHGHIRDGCGRGAKEAAVTSRDPRRQRSR